MKRFSLKLLSVAMFGSAVITSLPVAAHGYLKIARQVNCYNDGGYWSPNGSAIPNAACKAAFDESGTTQFIQKNEIAKLVSDYNNMDAVKRAIPDGEICSAGDSSKSGLNIPHPDWKKTAVQVSAENTIAIEHVATAPHNPSFRQFYLTKESYDPSMPIKWDDLELIHYDDYTVMEKGNTFVIPVPAGRSGDAVLVSRWQRYDPAGEGFYNCADITLVSDGSVPTEPTPEPTDPVVSLVELGSFLETGIISNSEIDDSVRFRIFDATGVETTDVSLQITAQNLDSWPGDIADMVMQDTKDTWVIGNWHGDHYMYDWNNHYANKVFAPSADFAYQLSLVKFVPTPEVSPTPVVATPTPSPTPVIVTATPIITPPPVTGDVIAFVPGETIVANGDIVSYDGSCFEAKNNPGIWEAPSSASWFWSEVPCEGGVEVTPTPAPIATPTPVVTQAPTMTPAPTATPAPVVTPTPVVGESTWEAEKVYNTGDTVVVDGITYTAGWWTKGDKPGTTGQWGVWKAK
ncbi:Spindolin [Psychromonas sp. psych-6C06]|uniref:lytic polysaccharide monooxygenase n=1 Tax=Psychromonas sp. psych-6C06 TaxID=2058089 RepID=UPI000C330249|nr:lytic polysaccharide monooxygenase [Psychromonas sp. psych-6C06]PKF61979.1 Spindolin [Psychromonas sp. psych-6C06]